MSGVRASDWSSERVRRLREGRQFSQEKLARWLGVSIASVRRWERGRARPTGLSVQRLEELEVGDS